MPIETLSPELAYATKDNIVFPGNQGEATVAEARAQQRLADATPTGKGPTTIPAGSVTIGD